MAQLGDHGAASTTSTSLFSSGSMVGRLQTPGTDGLHGAGVLDLDLFLVNGEHGGGKDLLGQPSFLSDLHHHQDSQDDQDQTRHHCCESNLQDETLSANLSKQQSLNCLIHFCKSEIRL